MKVRDPRGRTPNEKRRRLVAKLREEGLSLGQVAKRLGVTKQAVSALLHYAGIGTGPPRRTVLCSQCRQPVGPAIGSNGRHRRELICLACVAKNRHAPFGVRLRALRLAAGLSAHELGARIGVNAGAVLYWELRDKRPSEALVRRLADALGVKVRMLSVGVPK